MSLNNSEPVIVAFCCYYCAYSAADLAGSMRLQYPPNIRIIMTRESGPGTELPPMMFSGPFQS